MEGRWITRCHQHHIHRQVIYEDESSLVAALVMCGGQYEACFHLFFFLLFRLFMILSFIKVYLSKDLTEFWEVSAAHLFSKFDSQLASFSKLEIKLQLIIRLGDKFWNFLNMLLEIGDISDKLGTRSYFSRKNPLWKWISLVQKLQQRNKKKKIGPWKVIHPTYNTAITKHRHGETKLNPPIFQI